MKYALLLELPLGRQTVSKDEPYFWILIPESCIEFPINQHNSPNVLTNTSPFRPRYTEIKDREEVSMCDAEYGEVSPEDAAERLNNYQRDTGQNLQKYAATAKLTKTDLEWCGFTIERDDVPYSGHTNAYIAGKMGDKENKLKRHLLMNAANQNTIIRINT